MPTFYKNTGNVQMLRDVLVSLKDDFNSVLLAKTAEWAVEDQTFASAMDWTYVPITMEEVPATNMHVGSIPSFVQEEDRIENYPMIAVVGERSVPDAEDARSDQQEVHQNGVSIHSFARGNPHETGVDIAYAAWLRAERMADAISEVIKLNSKLRKITAGVSKPVLVERSEPWLFPEDDSGGPDWCWVAVRHLYTVKNYSIK